MKLRNSSIRFLEKVFRHLKLTSVLYRIRRVRYKRQFSLVSAFPKYNVGRVLPYGLKQFIYKDETWNCVKFLPTIFFAKALHMPYTVSDNEVDNVKIQDITSSSAKVRAGKRANNWVYWYLDRELPENYLIGFDAVIRSFLTEFQLAFNHTDIANRLRFQVVDNAYVSFDVVRDGFFFNKMFTKPFSFDMHKKYSIKLLVCSNVYSFIVDDRVLLSIKDNTGISKGGFVFVLWDKDGVGDMAVDIDNFQIREVSVVTSNNDGQNRA